MNGRTLVERIRSRHLWLKSTDAVGVTASFGKATQVDAENRSIRVTANTDDVDLEDEVVVPSGADTGYFFANRKIFLDHDYTFDKCVGVLRAAAPRPSAKDHRAWMCHLHIYDLSRSPYGNDILTIAEEGGIGTSIGFVAKDYGNLSKEEQAAYTKGGKSPSSIVRSWKWLELSVTAMPCNVACQSVAGAKADDSKMGILDNLLTKGRIKRETATALGMPTTRGVVIRCLPLSVV